MKGLLMLLVPFVLGFTGCGRAPVAPVPSTAPWSAPADEPRAIVEAYLQAYSRGDIDASLRLLADDVVQEQDPPGVKVQGKADVELNLRANAAWKRQIIPMGSPTVDDGKVSWPAEVKGDDFQIMGVERMRFQYGATIEGGRIRYLRASPNSEDWDMMAQRVAGGIGIKVRRTEQGVRIEEFARGSPAQEAGLKRGDVVVAVDGVKTPQMREGEAELRIRGPVGSRVRLSVLQEGSSSPVELEIGREDLAQFQ